MTATVESPPETAPEEEDEESGLGQAVSLARELVIVVVVALVVATLLRVFVGQMFIIPSGSMENTLMIGDRIVAQKVKDFHRGDVVVFADPGGWLSPVDVKQRGTVGHALEFVGLLPDTSTGHLIKRVIGMPGDTVVCCDVKGQITVNGQALDETSYLYRDAAGKQVPPSTEKFSVVVPAGKLFVMGDHRDESADSRCHLSDDSAGQPRGAVAFVPEKLVVGEDFAVATPFNRATILHRPATFAAVPEPTAPAPAQAVIKPAGVIC